MAGRGNSNEYQDGAVVTIADLGLEPNMGQSFYQLRKCSFGLGLVWLIVSVLLA